MLCLFNTSYSTQQPVIFLLSMVFPFQKRHTIGIICNLFRLSSFSYYYTFMASQVPLVVKKFAYQCERHERCRFNPWVRKIACRREWQTTLVFLPVEPHGQRNLADYSHGVAKSQTRLTDSSTQHRHLTFLHGFSWFDHSFLFCAE